MHQKNLQQRSARRSLSAKVHVYRIGGDEEAGAERKRCAQLTIQQRLAELAHLRRVAYGSRLDEPLRREATWQRIDW